MDQANDYEWDSDEVKEEKKKQKDSQDARARKQNGLIINVFDTPAGKVLIDQWKEELIHGKSSSGPNPTMYDLGVYEGVRSYKERIISIMKINEVKND